MLPANSCTCIIPHTAWHCPFPHCSFFYQHTHPPPLQRNLLHLYKFLQNRTHRGKERRQKEKIRFPPPFLVCFYTGRILIAKYSQLPDQKFIFSNLSLISRCCCPFASLCIMFPHHNPNNRQKQNQKRNNHPK